MPSSSDEESNSICEGDTSQGAHHDEDAHQNSSRIKRNRVRPIMSSSTTSSSDEERSSIRDGDTSQGAQREGPGEPQRARREDRAHHDVESDDEPLLPLTTNVEVRRAPLRSQVETYQECVWKIAGTPKIHERVKTKLVYTNKGKIQEPAARAAQKDLLTPKKLDIDEACTCVHFDFFKAEHYGDKSLPIAYKDIGPSNRHLYPILRKLQEGEDNSLSTQGQDFQGYVVLVNSEVDRSKLCYHASSCSCYHSCQTLIAVLAGLYPSQNISRKQNG